MQHKSRILLVQRGAEQLELFAYILEAMGFSEVIKAQDVSQALNFLKENPFVDGSVVDDNLEHEEILQLHHYQRRLGLSQPFVLLSSKDKSYFSFEHSLNVFTIRKPIQEEDLKSKISKIFRMNQLPISNFFPVSLSLIQLMEPVHVPLFIKINDLKFVRLTSEESKLDQEQLKRFRDRGIAMVFIEGSQVQNFIASFKRNVFSRKAWHEVSAEDLADGTRLNIDLMRNLATKFGWSDSVVELASHNLRKTLVLAQTHPELKSVLKHFQKIERFGFAEHMTLCGFVATYIQKKMQASQSLDLANVAMAALYHDLAVPDPLWNHHRKHLKNFQAGSDLNSPEMKIFLEHPNQSAEMLKDCEFAPPGFSALIRQHHEFPSTKGFPRKLKAAELDPLACTLILAEEFVFQWFESHSSLDPVDFIRFNQAEFSDDVFASAVNAFVR